MLEKIIKYIHKNFIPLFVSMICAYALYRRIMILYQHTLWADELCQLRQMQGTFLELLRGLPNNDFCSYLSGDHYLIYPFFKIFSFNKWGLAIPHIIITIVGFYILYLICKRYFKSAWAYFITFSIVCFNATLTAHATEIRPYAVLPTLALAVFYLFEKIADLNFQLSLPKRIAATIFFILVIWFHVYGIIMFLGCFLFTIFSKYREQYFTVYLKHALFFIFFVLFFALPLWFYSVFGPHLGVPVQVVKTFEFIPNPLHDIIGFLKGIFCNLIGFNKLYLFFLGIFIPFIFSYKNRHKQLLLLFFVILLPISFIFIFDLARKYWFLQRQFIWTMPLFAFFIGWAWDSLIIRFAHNSLEKKPV